MAKYDIVFPCEYLFFIYVYNYMKNNFATFKTIIFKGYFYYTILLKAHLV